MDQLGQVVLSVSENAYIPNLGVNYINTIAHNVRHFPLSSL